jgi:lipopolysaccharide transport system ATP-binding protein
MSIAIQIQNLSKAYQLGQIGTGTISRDLERWWASIRGKEDPFLKIGETNDRTTKSDSNIVWSLKDINVEIQQGDAVGIIGRNGAGKSTLLKLLSRVTAPTTGTIKAKGRIASLLEVGTGFHPELSGKENIYLNGAILGMRKKEIDRKLEEIIDFSGVERYIDTPVKRYSSGMYVRLAFAVAAHLDSEILIVDEVLAVGDAEFQKKCLGKMEDVSKGEGKTVLFVSHNMQSIQNLCNSCIYLDKGLLVDQNDTHTILTSYLKSSTSKFYKPDLKKLEQLIFVDGIYLENTILIDGNIIVFLEVKSKIEKFVSVDFRIISELSVPVAFSSYGALNYDDKFFLTKGLNKLVFKINIANLAIGGYIISVDITEPNVQYFDRCEDCLYFEIVKISSNKRQLEQNWNYGYIQLPIIKV